VPRANSGVRDYVKNFQMVAERRRAYCIRDTYWQGSECVCSLTRCVWTSTTLQIISSHWYTLTLCIQRNLDLKRAPLLVLISGSYWLAFPGTLCHVFVKQCYWKTGKHNLELIIISVQICQHL